MASVVLGGATACAPDRGEPDIGDAATIELCVGEVEIPDPALREFLLSVVAQPEPPEGEDEPEPVVLAENLRRLRGINAPGLGIKDLTGLECAQGILGLGLADNEIEDLRPLLNLTGLTQIELSNNKVTDLSVLSQLFRLERVALDQNGVTDLRPLAALQRLASLDLAGNGITDVGPLAGLTALEVLVLSDNELKDVRPLAGLTNLFGLRLSDNAIASIAALSELRNLSFLDLEGNAIETLAPLAKATNMRELEASRNKLTGLQGVEAMTQMTRLVAQQNEITTTEGVAALTSMSVLDLGDNALTEIPGLQSMRGLRRLVIAANFVTDLSPAEGLFELRDLDVRYNEGLTDLSVVGTMPLLGFVGAGGYAQSQDLSALAGNEVLRSIIFVEATAGDLGFFAELPALETIDFTGTPLTAPQVEQISHAKALQTITVRDTGIADIGPLALLPLLKVFDAGDNALSSVAPAAAWTDLRTLRIQNNPVTALDGLQAHERLSAINAAGTLVDDLGPLVANETFRQGDTVVLEGAPLDEGDCDAIKAIVARNGVVKSDVDCG